MEPTQIPEPVRAHGGIGKPRTWLPVAGIVILSIVAWSWISGPRRATAAVVKTPPAVQVDMVAAKLADVPVYLEGLGTIKALYTDTITPRVDGRLDKVGFTEGQSVRKGAFLAQIDPRPYKAALDQASATEAKDAAVLASARRDLERYEILAPHELASKQTLEDQRGTVAALEAQVRIDRAAVESARTQLDYTTLTSPIDGRTGIRLIDAGNIVHASDTSGIVVVTQVQPISCIFALPEDALPSLAAALGAGAVAVVALSRDGRTELDRGTVTLIDNQIDQSTGTIRVKANFPNTHDTLWPGQFVNARVLVRTVRNALVMPSAAVMRGINGLYTYVVRRDSTVEVRPLKLGVEYAGLTVVEAGLRLGERVVTTNQYRLQPGARVRSTGAAEPGPAPGVRSKAS